MHFADKDELILAVCDETFELCDHFVEQRVSGIDDPLARLEERGRAYVQFGVEHPEHYRLMFMGKMARARTDPEDLLVASGFAHLLDNVTACIAAGSIDARHDPLMVATGLWTLVHGITSLAVSVPSYPVVGLDALFDHMLDVYCGGLAGS
jgi:AcrR family transcriptional regulator